MEPRREGKRVSPGALQWGLQGFAGKGLGKSALVGAAIFLLNVSSIASAHDVTLSIITRVKDMEVFIDNRSIGLTDSEGKLVETSAISNGEINVSFKKERYHVPSYEQEIHPNIDDYRIDVTDKVQKELLLLFEIKITPQDSEAREISIEVNSEEGDSLERWTIPATKGYYRKTLNVFLSAPSMTVTAYSRGLFLNFSRIYNLDISLQEILFYKDIELILHDQDTVQDLLNQAEAFLREKHYEDAYELYMKLIKTHHFESPDVLSRVHKCFNQLPLDAALAEKINDSKARIQLYTIIGDHYYYTHDYVAARKAYSKLLDLPQDQARSYITIERYAASCLEEGKCELALNVLEGAPDLPDRIKELKARLYYKSALLKLKKYTDTEPIDLRSIETSKIRNLLKQSLETFSLTQALNAMGVVYLLEANPEYAVLYLEKATRAQPENANYQFNLALAKLFAAGITDDFHIRQEFERAIDLNPDLLFLYYRILLILNTSEPNRLIDSIIIDVLVD